MTCSVWNKSKERSRICVPLAKDRNTPGSPEAMAEEATKSREAWLEGLRRREIKTRYQADLHLAKGSPTLEQELPRKESGAKWRKEL